MAAATSDVRPRRWRPPLARAVSAAREVLALRGIDAPEAIDLEALAADLRIALRRAPIGNAEGRLVRAGRRGVVTIDEAAFISEKWRFVLAHEIGHFVLHATRDDLTCFPKAAATREEKSRRYLDEQAANDFAAELLVPAEMVRARIDGNATSTERACAIAREFGVSLPVAALRVLDLWDDPCTVRYEERGTPRWATAKGEGVDGRARSIAIEGFDAVVTMTER